MKKTSKKVSNKKSVKPAEHLRAGSDVFIRTVTSFFVGTIVSVSRDRIVLRSCSWIADTGRFTQAMATGQFSEVEVWPPEVTVGINRSAVIDDSAWGHPLPVSQK